MKTPLDDCLNTKEKPVNHQTKRWQYYIYKVIKNNIYYDKLIKKMITMERMLEIL